MSATGANAFHPEGLENLVRDRKGDRSYERLSRDCGGNPTAKRLFQLASQPLINFPGPDILRGLSRGLGVPVSAVVSAAARSVGIDMGEETDDLVLVGGRRLPASSQELLIGMCKEMLELQEAGEHAS